MPLREDPPPRYAAAGPSLAGCLGLMLVVTFSSPATSGVGESGGALPNVTLTTHDGRTVRFYDDLIKGKTVAINLIYTTCRYSCPLETAKLAEVQRLLGDRMGRDVFFYSLTIDPEHDTPAVLHEYAERFRAGPGWLFLTGPRAEIDRIATRVGLYAPRSRDNKDSHMPYLLVGNDATGQWMRNSAVDNPRFIARTINALSGPRAAPLPGLKPYAEAARLTFTRGEYIFASQCAVCHTIGRGDYIGPDLSGVTDIRGRAWLTRMIVAPDRLMAERDPIAVALATKYKQVRMPNLGLTPQHAAAIIDYIDERSRAIRTTAAAPPEAPPTALAAGDSSLDAIVAAYVRIQRTLYANRVNGVGSEAGTIAAESAKLGGDGDSIHSTAGTLAKSSDITSAREAFGTLGHAIIACLKARHARPAPGIRIAYCPMVRKYWLQEGDTVRNPFYGPSMPDCGRLLPDIPELMP